MWHGNTQVLGTYIHKCNHIFQICWWHNFTLYQELTIFCGGVQLLSSPSSFIVSRPRQRWQRTNFKSTRSSDVTSVFEIYVVFLWEMCVPCFAWWFLSMFFLVSFFWLEFIKECVFRCVFPKVLSCAFEAQCLVKTGDKDDERQLQCSFFVFWKTGMDCSHFEDLWILDHDESTNQETTIMEPSDVPSCMHGGCLIAFPGSHEFTRG